MRLVNFKSKDSGACLVGALIPGDPDPSAGGLASAPFAVVDLTAALGVRSGLEFVRRGASAIEAAKKVIAAGTHRTQGACLLAPLQGMEKVLCVGMNYVDHCTEQNYPIPEEPIIFNKTPSTIANPGDEIVKTPIIKELDFEVELAIVVGRGGRHIPKDKAMEHVFGYTVAHDVSARHWQMKRNGQQWFLGKTFDSFTPIGPCIVTADAIDVEKKSIRCILNGKVVQSSSTEQMIFKTAYLISWCSQFMTLKPGDLILTGTPPGVGCFRKPQLFMKGGDVVTVEVEGIGAITNTVVEKSPVYTPQQSKL